MPWRSPRRGEARRPAARGGPGQLAWPASSWPPEDVPRKAEAASRWSARGHPTTRLEEAEAAHRWPPRERTCHAAPLHSPVASPVVPPPPMPTFAPTPVSRAPIGRRARAGWPAPPAALQAPPGALGAGGALGGRRAGLRPAGGPRARTAVLARRRGREEARDEGMREGTRAARRGERSSLCPLCARRAHGHPKKHDARAPHWSRATVRAGAGRGHGMGRGRAAAAAGGHWRRGHWWEAGCAMACWPRLRSRPLASRAGEPPPMPNKNKKAHLTQRACTRLREEEEEEEEGGGGERRAVIIPLAPPRHESGDAQGCAKTKKTKMVRRTPQCGCSAAFPPPHATNAPQCHLLCATTTGRPDSEFIGVSLPGTTTGRDMDALISSARVRTVEQRGLKTKVFRHSFIAEADEKAEEQGGSGAKEGRGEAQEGRRSEAH
ncbi:unnamed protein product [Prorocentrum cordatum]|uniref:Uncharacterized protein n=1 Tax=Prorocentrum cordatum TaxID=2364126 RepID=A0ABN9QHF1_9DINO|nr:unnamed protein product [Polarella glacialis]